MKNTLSFLWAVLFVFATSSGHSEEKLDPASQEALKKTMELLNNPSLRKTAIDDASAKRADKAVSALSRGDATLKNDIYSLSSVIFERIAKESGGDVTKMNALVIEAQRNPASFAEKYFPAGSPEAAKLSELAGKASVKNPVDPKRP